MPEDRFLGPWNSFVAAGNAWARFVQGLSPASPDYEEQVRRKARGKGLLKKFRALEKELNKET